MAELVAKTVSRVAKLLMTGGQMTKASKLELVHVAAAVNKAWVLITKKIAELKSLTPAESLLVIDKEAKFRGQLVEFSEHYYLFGYLCQALWSIADEKCDMTTLQMSPTANTRLLRAILNDQMDTLAEYHAHSSASLVIGIFYYKYLKIAIGGFINMLLEKLKTGELPVQIVVAAIQNIQFIIQDSSPTLIADTFEMCFYLTAICALVVGDNHGSRAAVFELGYTPAKLIERMRQLAAANSWWSANIANCALCILQLSDI